MIIQLEVKYSGIILRYNNKFWSFYWKPYCPNWIDKDGVSHKSKRFQFISFEINRKVYRPKPLNKLLKRKANGLRF